MIIKFIPETEAEKQSMIETEFTGVIEFMIFGNRKEEDGNVMDFHNWRGNHRYLLGGLTYFYEIINDDRKVKLSSQTIQPSNSDGVARQFKLHKKAPVENPNIQIIDLKRDE